MEPRGPHKYFDEQGTASAVIHSVNEATHNRILNKAIVVPSVPSVQEEFEAVNTATHFPKLSPLLNGHGTDLLIKSWKEMPDQRTIDSIVDQLNNKSKHLYKLPFELPTLRNRQRIESFLDQLLVI